MIFISCTGLKIKHTDAGTVLRVPVYLGPNNYIREFKYVIVGMYYADNNEILMIQSTKVRSLYETYRRF